MASSVTLLAPYGFFEQDWRRTFEDSLFDGADELGQLEQYNVMQRTPVLTGALQSDVSYKVGPKSDRVIVQVYSDTQNQLDEWNRVYDIYQEGGVLGAGSNNGSGNHQMFAQIMTTDIAEIQMWGAKWLEIGAAKLASGKGSRP